MKLQTRINQQSDSYVARRVAMDVLGMTQEEIVVDYACDIGKASVGKMNQMMTAYDDGKPLAYVLGYEIFAGRRFLVDERVLIPRAETEELVQLVREKAMTRMGQRVLLLDMGTGSGCVGISIMDKIESDTCCVLCDVSEGALEVASHNAHALGVDVDMRQVDVMRLTDDDQGLDEFLEEADEVVIVANLPYIPEGYGGVEDDVQAREPHLALYSGTDGLGHYRALVEWMQKHSGKKKWSVWMEMMTEQGRMIMEEYGKQGTACVHETFHPNIVIVEYNSIMT